MPTKHADNHAALIAYLAHEVDAAREEQNAFGEASARDVENALQWKADGALVAVFTERHAKIALDQVNLGRDLLPIYENLIDRLTLLASGYSNTQAEVRAIATLARSLKEFLP